VTDKRVSGWRSQPAAVVGMGRMRAGLLISDRSVITYRRLSPGRCYFLLVLFPVAAGGCKFYAGLVQKMKMKMKMKIALYKSGE
jgi:hypothetical protein